MSETVIPVERLEGGLKAAFIHLPHFRTSAVRLTVKSGALHEADETPGAAHYVEHLTFEGTEDFSTEEDIHQFTLENGLEHNAITRHTEVEYIVNGYDLESVARLATQIVFAPQLQPESAEKERNPILDEINRDTSGPAYVPNQAHLEIMKGTRYARPILGTVGDIEAMSHEDLLRHYTRHYRLGNTVLVVASAEPVERQREFVQTMLSGFHQSGTDVTTPLELPTFNPTGQRVSLQSIDLPPWTTTSISLNYPLPETYDRHEQFRYGIVVNSLASLVHRRLRNELAICYSATATSYGNVDLNFDTESAVASFNLFTQLEGAKVVAGLDAMLMDVALRELPADVIEAALQTYRRSTKDTLESGSAYVASLVRDKLAAAKYDEVDLEEATRLADMTTVESVRRAHREVTDIAPLVAATSPDPRVLGTVGEWAVANLAA